MERMLRYGEGRDALIVAAVQVAAERGLRGLTFRAVAARAGVNNSLVAHHFGDRESLLRAALDWAVEQSIAITGLIAFESEERLADALIEGVKASPELQAFQYEMILEARRNPTFRPAVEDLYDRYLDAVREALGQLGITKDLDAVTRHTFAAFDGLVMQYLVRDDEDALRVGLHDLWRSLMRRSAAADTAAAL